MSDISDPGPTDLNTTELVRRWFPDVSAPNARRLEGGWMNDVFALDTDAGPFVLRLLQPEATEEMTAWSHGLLDRIAPRAPTVLAPLRTPTGASYVPSEARLATLERFVNGRLGTRTGADRAPPARALGALHRALSEVQDLPPRPGYPAWVDLDWRENRWWSWSRADRDALGARVGIEVLDRAIEEVPVALSAVDSSALPTFPIHSDYHEGNLLIVEGGPTDGEVAAIIDWDETRLDWRVWDVANALWSLCRNDTNTALIAPAAAAFLEAYESTGPPVLSNERGLVTLCTRATRLFEALWGIGEMQRGHTGWDYFEQNVAAIAGIEELDLG